MTTEQRTLRVLIAKPGLDGHDRGAKVIILEADKRLGGATWLSGGVVYAAGTSVQNGMGISDTPQDMYDYIMTLNGWQTRPDIIRPREATGQRRLAAAF